jgi:type IV secretory pathway VirB6-like protein
MIPNDIDLSTIDTSADNSSAVTIYQCFDVTNYKSRLSEIDLNADNEGVSIVNFFDGKKGNFTTIYKEDDIDNHLYITSKTNSNNRHIFTTNQAIPFSKVGRLKFLFLDSNLSLELLKDNAGSLDRIDTSYFDNNYIDDSDNSFKRVDGSNINNDRDGFKIDFNIRQSYSNGENLQIVMCQENGDCNEDIDPILVGGSDVGDKIIMQNEDNSFAFTRSGIMKNITTSPKQNYYSHSGLGATEEDDDKLQLAFNIYNPTSDLDNRDNDCVINDPFVTCYPSSHQNCIDNSDPCCNGKLTKNPYYKHKYCLEGYVPVKGEQCCPNDYTDSDENDDVNLFDDCINEGSTVPMTVTAQDTICSSFPLKADCYSDKICANTSSLDAKGNYKVVVRVQNTDDIDSSHIINSFISPFLNFLDGTDTNSGFVERAYKNIVQNDLFINLVQLFSVLFVTIYGIAYFMGISEMNKSQILKMVIKFGIIYFLVSPDSWYWYKLFFVDSFKDGMDYIIFLMSVTFDRDIEILNAIDNNDFSDKSLLFKSSDRMFQLLFNNTIHIKILALIFKNYFGIVYVIFIYWSIFTYIKTFFAAICFYIIAQVQISVLLIFGPIFITFLFFSRTASLFRNWYENLLGLSLQQVFIVLFLSFFNNIIYEIIKMNFNYMVCWGTVWSIPVLDIGSIFEFWSLPSTGLGLNPSSHITSGSPNLIAIILLFFLCKMMYDFIEYGSRVSTMIVGNISIAKDATDLAGSALKSLTSGAAYAKNYAIKASGISEKMEKRKDKILDKYFDSGKTADENDAKQRKQNEIERRQARNIMKAGDAAENQYLKDHNITNISKLIDEQKKQMHKRREDAMNQAAKDMGIDTESEAGRKKYKELKESTKRKRTDRESRDLLNRAIDLATSGEYKPGRLSRLRYRAAGDSKINDYRGTDASDGDAPSSGAVTAALGGGTPSDGGTVTAALGGGTPSDGGTVTAALGGGTTSGSAPSGDASDGAASGGASGGGSPSDGAASGGASGGGSPSDGAASGGASGGGSPSDGAASGGASGDGSPSDGAASGGASAPPLPHTTSRPPTK